jgi:hypothetical protein
MARAFIASSVAFAVLLATPTVVSAKIPDTWDNLIKVDSKRLEAVYLLPNADFRPYTKVMLDPTEVAFKPNWRSDINQEAQESDQLGGGVTDKEAMQIAAAARTGFEKIFAKAFTDAGYQVVTTPGPDVLRLITAVANLYIDAPDTGMSMGNTYTAEAGQATVVIEARDSQTNAVLGRAVDVQTAGDMPGMRTSASNEEDFKILFEQWAKIAAKGLGELKAMSPIDTEGQPSSR